MLVNYLLLLRFSFQFGGTVYDIQRIGINKYFDRIRSLNFEDPIGLIFWQLLILEYYLFDF